MPTGTCMAKKEGAGDSGTAGEGAHIIMQGLRQAYGERVQPAI